MRIEWSFEDGAPDSLDPLGTMTLYEGAASFRVQTVFLDSWFEGIASGLQRLRVESSAEVDLGDEPYLLSFQRQDGGVLMSYRDSSLLVSDFSEFVRTIAAAGSKFIQQLRKAGTEPHFEALSEVIRSVNSSD
jgi:hypothetical protein